jgi:hypothetical protein
LAGSLASTIALPREISRAHPNIEGRPGIFDLYSAATFSLVPKIFFSK